TYDEGLGNRRVLRGSPLLVTTYDEQNKLLHTHSYARDTIAIPNLSASPLLRRSVVSTESETNYEKVTQPIVTQINYIYDDQGRVLEEQRLGRLDLTGDETTEFHTWASDDNTWVRDKILTHGIKDNSGTVLRISRNIYGDDATLLPLGQIGKG